MTLPAPFREEDGHVRADLGPASVCFTSRRGGVSSGPYASLNLGGRTDDDPAAVGENRRRAAVLTGVPRARWALGRQVHGAEVSVAGPVGSETPDDALPEADGQAVAEAGVVAVVLVADCLPVAVAGATGVAMLHCGWRPLAGGVVAAGVAALRALGETGALRAAIGPGARGCCYEVGDEVRAAFAAHGDAVRRGRNLDLAEVVRRDLADAGVGEVHDTGLCTMCSAPDRFFSHRRDGGVTGRQAGFAWRAS